MHLFVAFVALAVFSVASFAFPQDWVGVGPQAAAPLSVGVTVSHRLQAPGARVPVLPYCGPGAQCSDCLQRAEMLIGSLPDWPAGAEGLAPSHPAMQAGAQGERLLRRVARACPASDLRRLLLLGKVVAWYPLRANEAVIVFTQAVDEARRAVQRLRGRRDAPLRDAVLTRRLAHHAQMFAGSTLLAAGKPDKAVDALLGALSWAPMELLPHADRAAARRHWLAPVHNNLAVAYELLVRCCRRCRCRCRRCRCRCRRRRRRRRCCCCCWWWWWC